MDVGEQLTDGELLRIAEAINANPDKKIPDYLSTDDKETIKELLSILRARDQAVKVFFIRVNYLDVLKKSEELKAKQLELRNEAKKRYKEYKDYATNASQLREATEKIQWYLNSEYKRAEGEFEDVLVNLGHDLFLRLDSRPSKHKIFDKQTITDFSTGETFEVPRQVPASRFIRARVYRDFGHDKNFLDRDRRKSLQEQQMLEKHLKETRSPFAFNAFTLSVKAKDAAEANLLANPEALCDLSDKLTEAMDRKAAEQQKLARSLAGRAYGFQTSEYYETMRDVDVKRKQLRQACGWYIVAAAGEVLEELGQNLMCSA